jgi:hypothetical protein
VRFRRAGECFAAKPELKIAVRAERPCARDASICGILQGDGDEVSNTQRIQIDESLTLHHLPLNSPPESRPGSQGLTRLLAANKPEQDSLGFKSYYV